MYYSAKLSGQDSLSLLTVSFFTAMGGKVAIVSNISVNCVLTPIYEFYSWFEMFEILVGRDLIVIGFYSGPK